MQEDAIKKVLNPECKYLIRTTYPASGGVVFITIQKFQPLEGNVFEKLSDIGNYIDVYDKVLATETVLKRAELIAEELTQGK